MYRNSTSAGNCLWTALAPNMHSLCSSYQISVYLFSIIIILPLISLSCFKIMTWQMALLPFLPFYVAKAQVVILTVVYIAVLGVLNFILTVIRAKLIQPLFWYVYSNFVCPLPLFFSLWHLHVYLPSHLHKPFTMSPMSYFFVRWHAIFTVPVQRYTELEQASVYCLIN